MVGRESARSGHFAVWERKFFPTTATAEDPRMDPTAVAKYGEAQATRNA